MLPGHMVCAGFRTVSGPTWTNIYHEKWSMLGGNRYETDVEDDDVEEDEDEDYNAEDEVEDDKVEDDDVEKEEGDDVENDRRKFRSQTSDNMDR